MPPTLDRDLSGLPRRALAAFAARAARRVTPLIAPTADKYGPEAWEWLNATAATIRTVGAFARGRPVSRFTLDLAAELPRAAANAAATLARQVGPSPAIADAEIAFAVAAFAADVARAPSQARALQMATQAAATASAGPYPVARLLALDASTLAGMGFTPDDEAGPSVDPSDAGPLGELWPAGEPDGWASAWADLEARAAELPLLIRSRSESQEVPDFI